MSTLALVCTALLSWPAAQEPAPAAPRAEPAAGAPAEPRVDPQEAPAGLALLVGIDRYAGGRGVATLKGAKNDVHRAQSVLVDRFGFAPGDVKFLRDEEATHQAIVAAFRSHLIERAGAKTRVVFWFSGHGSRILDKSGLETSKDESDAASGAFDNSLIAHDSRAGGRDGGMDFSDDELYSLLRALAQRTEHVLVVTDCCHSAGATRGGREGCREVSMGDEPLDVAGVNAFWPADVPLLDDNAPERAVPFSYVHLAACGEHQEAGEFAPVQGQTYGTLTWFLTQALLDLQAGTSWRRLGEAVRARVAGEGNRKYQVVTWEGDLDREVFGGGFVAPPPGFAVERDTLNLILAAGGVHGVTPGTEFAIVGLDRKELGRTTVESVYLTWCTAATPADLPKGVALRAEPRGSLHGRAPLRLAVGKGADAALLKDCPWASAAPTESDYALEAEGEVLVLRDRDGVRVRRVPSARDEAQRELYREYCFRQLWAAVAHEGAAALKLEAGPADDGAKKLAQKCNVPLLEPTRAADGSPRAEVRAPLLTRDAGGGLVTLWVSNPTEKALYVSVLSLQENREVNVVLPPKNEGDVLLRPGARRAVHVLVGPSADWTLPRPMVDRYVAIGTPQPADYQDFTSEAPQWQGQRGGGGKRPAFLEAALSGTRGGGDDFWALGWLDLELQRQ